MSDIAAKTKASARLWPVRLSPDVWAVALSVIFIVLVVAGVFPRVPW